MASRVVKAKLKTIKAKKMAKEQVAKARHLTVETFKTSKEF